MTLFALKINDIINQIPNDPNFHYSLYVDDLQVGHHHMDINVIQRALQQCIDKFIHGLMITDLSSHRQKCRAMRFNILPGLHLNPILKLDNHNVEYCRDIKFL